MNINRFNIRVYGILINEQNQVLVSDEIIKGHHITKFPGGGLEFGEGIVDCLKREFMEETDNEIEISTHFYTTDFFQQSAYNPNHQIISIYYMVKPKHDFFTPSNTTTEEQSFRWIELQNISANNFTLPIDKVVGNLLSKYK
ncbi:MAG: NUDIX hydrolase [Bacteroidia bacterium]|nr:NUDIX hydrolase [Bacteroidia bacterium]